MNRILTVTLLVAGLTGNVFVYGQVRVIPGNRPVIVPAPARVVVPVDSVRVMRPDNMPCKVAKPVIITMPVKILRPCEPMPVNGLPVK